MPSAIRALKAGTAHAKEVCHKNRSVAVPPPPAMVLGRRGVLATLTACTISLAGPGESLAYKGSLQQQLAEIKAQQASGDFGPRTSGGAGRLLERVQKCSDEVKRVQLLAGAGEYQNAKALLTSGSGRQLQGDLGYATGLYANILDPKTASRTLAVYKRLESGLTRELPMTEIAARVALIEECLADLTQQLNLA
eukprot:gene8577-34013_t